MEEAPPPKVSGRPLLAAIAGWGAAAGAVYGVLFLASRLGARGFFRAHLIDVSAAFTLVAYALLFGALVVAFGWRGLRDQLGLRFTRVRHLLLAVPLWLLTALTGVFVALPLERWFGKPQSNTGPLVAAAHDPFAAPVLILSVVVAAPLCEELLFRGGIFGWLRGRVPVAAAAPVSAALFAAAHRLLPLFVLLFVFGLVAALYYRRTGSTLNTMVMHACQNGAAVIAVYAGLVPPSLK